MSKEFYDTVETQWTVDAVIERAKGLPKDKGLPSPTRPNALGDEYTFPTDPKTLEMHTLAQLRMQLGAYLGYTKMLLGQEELEFTAFKKVFEVKVDILSINTVTQWDGPGRAPGRELARSLVIDNNPSVKALFKDLIERETRVTKLRTQTEIYDVQLQVLSREQSRREAEYRA